MYSRHAELYALLLTDILVLVERHEERDKFYLRCYTVEGLGGVKEELSPVIRLKDCLLRSAAADKGPPALEILHPRYSMTFLSSLESVILLLTLLE